MSGNKEGGLYKAHMRNTRHIADSVFCNATAVEDFKLFHARLGHPSSSKLSHLGKCIGTSDFVCDIGTSYFVCDTCEMAKFHRLPFPVSTPRAAKAFDLVHVDLWGPYRHPDVTEAHYILTVLDDHTRSLWTFLL